MMVVFGKYADGERRSTVTLFGRTLASITEQNTSGRAAAAAVEDVSPAPTHAESPATESTIPAGSERSSAVTPSGMFC